MKILNWITLIIGVLAISLATYNYINQPQIVYVHNSDILQKYIGLKEANAIYEKKHAENQGKVDTIIALYQNKVAEYEENKSSFTKAVKDEKERLLMDEAERIKNFRQAGDDQLAKENEELLTGVLNQINAYAEIYAKEKHYDLVIGTTNSGNLMYGAEKLDVTVDFIKRLNEYYKNGL